MRCIMNKTIKSVMAVLVILTLCVGLLAGCGGNSIVGDWKVTGAEAMGQSVDPAEMGDTATAIVTFNADGTITSNGQSGGTWKLDGDKLSITDSGITLSGTFNGDNITIDMGFAKVIYSRA